MRPSFVGRKVDGNQPLIVEALEAHGCMVQSLAGVGAGVLDLLCGLHGRFFVVEVKMPGESLTPAQEKWIERWAGYPRFVVESVEQVSAVVKRVSRFQTQHLPEKT